MTSWRVESHPTLQSDATSLTVVPHESDLPLGAPHCHKTLKTLAKPVHHPGRHAVRNAANAAAGCAPCAPTESSANFGRPCLHSSHASVIGVSNMMHLRFHGMLSRADPAGPRITLFVCSGDVNGEMKARCMPDFRLCRRPSFHQCSLLWWRGNWLVCVYDNQIYSLVTLQRLAGHISPLL